MTPPYEPPILLMCIPDDVQKHLNDYEVEACTTCNHAELVSAHIEYHAMKLEHVARELRVVGKFVHLWVSHERIVDLGTEVAARMWRKGPR